VNSSFDVSIIICCFNSEKRLPQTLYHLSRQELNGLAVEVIIVDNNSSDNTSQKSVEIWAELSNPFHLRVINESNPGLSNARKTGVYKSNGDVIVFCDDDNWLDENYITQAYEKMLSNLNIGVLGGRTTAVFENSNPYWFNTYQNDYAVGVQALYSGNITERGYVWGAGFVMRKSIIIRIYKSGFKNFCSGRKGEILLAGDDSEICLWHVLLGFEIWYDETLHLKHYIPVKRLSKQELQKMKMGFASSEEFLNIYKEIIYFRKSKLNRFTNSVKLLLKFILLQLSLKDFLCKLSILFESHIFVYSNEQLSQTLKAMKKFTSNSV
jgi:glycosyltransferase involved in cell wall biosynthesis